MSRRNLAWLLGIAAVALLGLTVSYSAPPREKDKNYELVRLMVDVLDEVDHKYVKELDPDRKRKLVEDMINGGLEHLDPHSNFIAAHDYKQFNRQSKGKFGGVGIHIRLDRQGSGALIVESPMVGSPAYEAGVLAGDLIVKIDGKSTDSMRMNEAVDMIMGDPGTPVTLTVLHEGSRETVDLEMKRAEIEMQCVMGDLRKADNPKEWDFIIDKDNKLAYIRLTTFTETSPAELKAALEQAKKDGMRGLVLDLRSNPGGLLKAAVDISNYFLEDGRIVSTKGRDQKEEIYDAEPKKNLLTAHDCPLVVLVNRYSASASEIVSAALQDHKRAVIVGERSFGKGSVQNVIEMENHQSALKLTTASYWRPSGKNIHRFPDSTEKQEWGVQPNPGFEVKLTDEERIAYARGRAKRDVVYGKSTPPESAKAKTDKDAKPYVDKVLDRALEHLRGEVQKAAAGRGLPLTVPS
jgi:carboxyl-terminal processing protease